MNRKITSLMVTLALMSAFAGTVLADHETCALACSGFPMINWEHTCQGGTTVLHTLNLSANSFDIGPPVTFDEGVCVCQVTQVCSLNCTNDTGLSQGAACIGAVTMCDNQDLPFMAFGSNFTLGIGVMLMIAGAGVIADSMIRSQEKKRKEFME